MVSFQAPYPQHPHGPIQRVSNLLLLATLLAVEQQRKAEVVQKDSLEGKISDRVNDVLETTPSFERSCNKTSSKRAGASLEDKQVPRAFPLPTQRRPYRS